MPSSQNTTHFLVGVISDTHGLLRPEVADIFKPVNMIIHAGDIGPPRILDALRDIAPLKVVRGNMDYEEWACGLPAAEVVELGDVLLYVCHDGSKLDLDPVAAGFSAVINGHTHQPFVGMKAGVLFLNPGSAGQSRYGCPLSVALLHVRGTKLDTQIVELEA